MKSLKSLLLLMAATLILSPQLLLAQAGNDNPTGIAGMFNGNVTTAGSYDPYTGNATRSVTDIAVAGSLGAYPLAFARTANSRYTPGLETEFGEPGGWRHSYQWSIDSQYMVTPGTTNPLPTSYTVNFPDGRREIFRFSGSDSLMRASPGTRERFQNPAGDGDNYCYVILPDGGKIWFQMTIDRTYPDANDPGGRTYSSFDFTFLGIIDPYQQLTTITYPGDGSLTITEPGGRSLKLFYGVSTIGKNEIVLWRVRASDGRTVDYSYIEYTTPGGFKYTTLWHVFYDLGPEWSTYEYQADNLDPDGRPLLKSCVDPMFRGPMWRIAYDFVPLSPGSGAVYGQIRSEQYFSASNNVGDPVSSLTIDPNSNVRTETRGDGPVRTFTYNAAMLESSTDFKNVSASRTHDAAGFVNSLTDRRGNTTDFLVNALTGNPIQTKFPLTPPDTQRARVQVTYGNADCPDANNRDPNSPYYPCTVTNERGFVTKYFRDNPFKRVVRIEYPDDGAETFAYNNHGQVTSHGMTSGGTEIFEYDDSNGRLLAYRDPYHLTGVPTARFQYDARGRVSGATDPRGATLGDPNYTTNFEYDFRGQITRTTHPFEPGTSYRYSIVNQYNVDGTLKNTIDELGHTTEYGYDDYKRLSSSRPPIAYEGDATPRTTFFEYSRGANGTYAYDHTDASLGMVTTAGGRVSRTLYDENCRKRFTAVGAGNETATATYTYDTAGNLETVKDPLGQSTGAYAQYFYDARNRLTDFNDQISTNRNNRNHTVSWTYDLASNKRSELRANNQLITFDEYDPINRLKQQSVQRDSGVTDVTHLSYDYAGNPRTFQDGRGKSYVYDYDFLNRKTSLTYPPDDSGFGRIEAYHYDYANNLDTFTNRAGAIQTLEYDNRNRRTHQFWDTWPLYTIHEQWMTYDPVGNIRRVRTEGEDIDDFVYDFRNRKMSETQTPSGRPSRTVAYSYDADSTRKTMTYPSGYVLTYDYTTRNQLWHQYDGQGALATYAYDLNGNRTSRSLRNGTRTDYTPDALNRLQTVAHFRGGTPLGRFDYQYDSVSRIKSTKRDFARGDYYEYYLDDQLKSAQYDAYNVDLGSPWGAANVTSLIYDATGNRVSQSNTSTPSFGYSVNNLNQYTAVNDTTPDYDTEGNLAHYDGWAYVHNRQGQLRKAENGSTGLYFWYDGLKRQILRYVDNQWTYSAWDGWDLLEEYDINGNVIHTYVHGAATDEMLVRFDPGPALNRIWYYHDAQGSTTHLADDTGTVVERYKYPPADAGAPSIFDGAGDPIPPTRYDNRFLYTGRDYYRQGGFYDYRNRTYLPSLGRFLQPDPIGFAGGDSNRYRYAGNNPVNGVDPTGMDVVEITHPRGLGHSYFKVTAPQSGGYVWFDYGAAPAGMAGSGAWYIGSGPPSDQWQITRNTWHTTPEQDLVILTAFYNAYDEVEAAGGGPFYFFGPCNCHNSGISIINGALGTQGINFNPVDPNTGNIFDARGNWVGWEDFRTGNIYDSDFDFAGNAHPQINKTYFDLKGNSFYFNQNGQLVAGFAPLNLTSTGRGDWQTVGYFVPGGEPGEGTHPVSPDLF